MSRRDLIGCILMRFASTRTVLTSLQTSLALGISCMARRVPNLQRHQLQCLQPRATLSRLEAHLPMGSHTQHHLISHLRRLLQLPHPSQLPHHLQLPQRFAVQRPSQPFHPLRLHTPAAPSRSEVQLPSHLHHLLHRRRRQLQLPARSLHHLELHLRKAPTLVPPQIVQSHLHLLLAPGRQAVPFHHAHPHHHPPECARQSAQQLQTSQAKNSRAEEATHPGPRRAATASPLIHHSRLQQAHLKHQFRRRAMKQKVSFLQKIARNTRACHRTESPLKS
mmetsp:Transcript_56086/g.131286  ORF Transcript_56086/g.131286 Transcript_56086/m.131286 type:complete len:278 (-) Transcript_56086:1003-1836(-)